MVLNVSSGELLGILLGFLIVGLPLVIFAAIFILASKKSKKSEKLSNEEIIKRSSLGNKHDFQINKYLDTFKLIEEKGLKANFSKNLEWIVYFAERFSTKEEICTAYINYYAYGFHELLIKEWCESKGVSEEIFATVKNLKDEKKRVIILDFIKNVQAYLIGTIAEFPPGDIDSDTYISFISEMINAQDDEVLPLAEKYGVELTEKMKIKLKNDKFVFVDDWFDYLTKMIDKNLPNFAKQNKYMHLDLLILALFENYKEFCVIVNKPKASDDFSKCIFIEFLLYAEKVYGMSKKESDNLYWNRLSAYNKIMMNQEIEEKTKSLNFEYQQFLTKDLAKDPLQERIVISGNPIDKMKWVMDSRSLINAINEADENLFKTICYKYTNDSNY